MLDNLTRLATSIQSGFSSFLSTIVFLVDVENAYNNVNVRAVLTNLKILLQEPTFVIILGIN